MVHSMEDLDDAARQRVFLALTEDERMTLLFDLAVKRGEVMDNLADKVEKMSQCVAGLADQINILEERNRRSVSRIPPTVWVGLAGIGAVLGGAIGQTGWIP